MLCTVNIDAKIEALFDWKACNPSHMESHSKNTLLPLYQDLNLLALFLLEKFISYTFFFT